MCGCGLSIFGSIQLSFSLPRFEGLLKRLINKSILLNSHGACVNPKWWLTADLNWLIVGLLVMSDTVFCKFVTIQKLSIYCTNLLKGLTGPYYGRHLLWLLLAMVCTYHGTHLLWYYGYSWLRYAPTLNDIFRILESINLFILSHYILFNIGV